MGLLSWIKGKDARANHAFDEKDRELSAARRRINIEIDNLKKEQELERLRMEHALKMADLQDQMDEILGDEEEVYQNPQMSPEDALAMKLIDRIGEKKAAVTQTTSKKSYSDAELTAMWEKVPLIAKQQIPKSTDENIKEFVLKYGAPDADEDTLNRCVKLARTLTY